MASNILNKPKPKVNNFSQADAMFFEVNFEIGHSTFLTIV